jgi:CRP/FNR family transcriptional regulator
VVPVNDSTGDELGDVWRSVFPELAAISDPAWRSARDSAQLRIFPAGTILLRPGETSPDFVLIAAGRVRVCQRAKSGREIVLYRVCGGEVCLLTLGNLCGDTTYFAEAVAEERVLTIVIGRSSLEQAFARSEAFRRFLYAALSRRLSGLMDLIGQIAFQRLDARLAGLLLRLFDGCRPDLLHMTHQELAQELGTSREVVSRILKEFELGGIIRLHRGSIELLSPQAMALLTGGSPA